ncbi:sulfotransferase 6B1 [Bombina bombina]|uniref:sulfotransferase 6B1 n=1 Tax=Bombina bombina TaxID=8345 RepID=UPI00235A7522|nr:sulfotransferase 6B1 [Bombina bombina]
MGERDNFLQEVTKMCNEAKELPDDKLLFTYNGLLYPTIMCRPATFQALKSFEAREDDLLVVTYPKCGSNWTLQLLGHMVKCVYNKEIQPTSQRRIEFGAPDKFQKLKEESSPRILSTHLLYDNIPKTFFAKKVKILMVSRNPKDTAVSLFHFYNNNPVLPKCSSWDTFFQDFMTGKVIWGSYFDHALEWNKHIDDERILIVTFEEMKKDLEAAVKKISNFYGFNLTEEQIQQITEKGTFKSMKEKSKETHGEIGNIFFRKGDVGDWKNHFSEAQSQEVDAKFEECLAGTKLGEKLNYNAYCKM